MRQVKVRGTQEKHEPYLLNEFPTLVIQSIAKRIVHLKAVGKSDMSGNEFSRIFADAIGGDNFGKPVGVADVQWNGCAWSVKTVYNKRPHKADKVRLISGRNSPNYSSGISDPLADIQATGQSVLDIYNARIEQARRDHDDIRLVVLVRHMQAQEFLIYERTITPVAVNNYVWHKNRRGNLEAMVGDRHAFTWQPHGSQFTILERIPSGATRFLIRRNVPMLTMEQVLRFTQFKPNWVEIL